MGRKTNRRSPGPDNLCRVPDCGKPASARGLCVTHTWRANHGKPEAATTIEARQYQLPSSRAPRPKAERFKRGQFKVRVGPTSDDGGADGDSPRDVDFSRRLAEAERDERRDEVQAALCELAICLGAQRLDHPGGPIFLGRDCRGAVQYNREVGKLLEVRIEPTGKRPGAVVTSEEVDEL